MSGKFIPLAKTPKAPRQPVRPLERATMDKGGLNPPNTSTSRPEPPTGSNGNQTKEKKVIDHLVDQGYTVEEVNPNANKFNEKYWVYKKTSIGKKIAVVDENGSILAEQG